MRGLQEVMMMSQTSPFAKGLVARQTNINTQYVIVRRAESTKRDLI